MKKQLLSLAVCVLAGVISTTHAAIFLDDDYSTFANADLVGQEGWLQTSTATANPIQVLNGDVILGTSGQDAYKALSSAVPSDSGTSLYTGINLSLSAAQATGDYFIHLSNPLATTSNFYQRLFARSSGEGFQLGLVDTSGTGFATTWGVTVLSFDTLYTVVVAWDFVAGATNDAFAVYVDPASLIRVENTPYLTHTWTSATAEPAALAAANFRQGSASNAPTVAIESLIVTDSFALAAVPEPEHYALGVAGLLFAVVLLRRRTTSRP
jgi:hypothetical protein